MDRLKELLVNAEVAKHRDSPGFFRFLVWRLSFPSGVSVAEGFGRVWFEVHGFRFER